MYRWVEHTAEVELHIEAPSPQDVFREALSAFAEVVGGGGREPARHDIWLTAPDRAALLVHWLEELIYLAEIQAFVPEQATSLDSGHKELRARVVGTVGTPRPLVKAVTYHGLEFARRGKTWHAKLVLDV